MRCAVRTWPEERWGEGGSWPQDPASGREALGKVGASRSFRYRSGPGGRGAGMRWGLELEADAVLVLGV